MSKMGDICIEIADLLDQGFEPDQVAYRLGIPLEWIFSEIVEDMIEMDI